MLAATGQPAPVNLELLARNAHAYEDKGAGGHDSAKCKKHQRSKGHSLISLRPCRDPNRGKHESDTSPYNCNHIPVLRSISSAIILK